MTRRKYSNLLATSVATLAACAPSIEPSDRPLIDEYIWSLPYLPVEPEQVNVGMSTTPAREGDYQCVVTNLQETRQYDKIVAYAANSESLWPGALVAGDSIYTGLFTPMVFDRAPLTFSVGLENLDGRKSGTMEVPSLSAYRDEVGKILDAAVLGATPANIYSEIEQVHSEEQLSLALGVDVSWGLGTGHIESSFDWQRIETRSRFLVKFMQTYYTVDVDSPAVPSEVFAPGVTLEEVTARITPANPPVYVSSITYGRMVLFTFESEYSAEEMNAALEFTYSGGVDVSGSVGVSYKEMLSKSKITAFILGGSGMEAVQTIDSYDALIDFIQSGGNYSRESPGAPVAYKLAHLKDNSPARMSFTTDYDMKDCDRVSQKLRVVLKSIQVQDDGGDAGSQLEVYGQIWAEGDGSLMLFDRNDGNYVSIGEGETWPAGSQIGEGILAVNPQPGQAVRLRAHLRDVDDFLNPDDDLGSETVLAPFETGWRRDVQLTLTGDGARLVLTYGLTPI
jgi:thiol-activated cytolysin